MTAGTLISLSLPSSSVSPLLLSPATRCNETFLPTPPPIIVIISTLTRENLNIEKYLMNLQIVKMSRRKQAKPNRLNEDEDQEEQGVFNGELELLWRYPPVLQLLLPYLSSNENLIKPRNGDRSILQYCHHNLHSVH